MDGRACGTPIRQVCYDAGMRDQPLTMKQEAFASAYVETGNASEAYRLAYDASRSTRKSIEQNASKLLRHAKIAPRIQALQALVAKETVLDLGSVVDSFREVYERSMQHHMVFDSKGKPTGEFQFNAAGANKAMENIGRLLGFYVERSEHKNLNMSVDLSKLSTEQLDAIITNGRQLRAQLALSEGRTEE